MTTTGPVALCPEGHASTDPDYCDQCGAKIGGPAPAVVPPTEAVPAATGSTAGAAAGATSCPSCGAGRDPSTKFCEVCGYDFVTGAVPTVPPLQPAALAEEPETAPALPPVVILWRAVVSADRAFYDRNGSDQVQFPLGAPTRTFDLADEQVSIGRRSRSRGITPTIDLGDPPEDAAVSHAHATLLRQPDGSYSLVDNGSTNGTFVNDGTDPVAANTPIPLAAGDRVYVGAWTRVTLERA